MHRLSAIRIINFKSIIECDLNLTDYTPLVGYNNAGKSNIIKAIKWLLQKSTLNVDDFKNPDSPVQIIGTISGITDDLLMSLDDKHKKSIEKFLDNGCLTIRRIQEKPGAKATEIKLHVRKVVVIDGEDEWNLNPAGIDNAISSLFPEPIHIGAMENAEEDVSKSKAGSTIGKLLSKIIEPIEQNYGEHLKQQLLGISKLLDANSDERAPELVAFDQDMNEKIDVFFRGIKVKVHVPTPELKEVFSKGTLKVFEPGRIGGKDVSSMGHGAQRSLQMALIQHLSEIQKGEDNNLSTTLLLIDEPELYLHPQAIEVVRDALKKLSRGNYQIVFSTHSPLLITEQEIPYTILVRKTNELGTHKRQTLHEAIQEVLNNNPHQREVLFSLTNSSKILFCENVVLAEGKTEQRLLPIIFQEIMKYSLGSAKIALVEQSGSGNTRKSMKILDAMGLQNKAIVDLDYVFKTAMTNGMIEENDTDCIQCKEILSEISTEVGFDLGDDGWPKSSSTMTASDAFFALAKNERATKHISSLHEKMKTKGIWLWTKGCIEHHLGLERKSEKAWSEFAQRIIDNEPEEVIADFVFVKGCLDWIKE